MLNRFLVIIVLLAAGSVGGFYFGWSQRSADTTDDYKKLVISHPLLIADGSGGERSAAGATTIADVLSLAPGFQQYLGSHLFANGLNKSQIQSEILRALQIKPANMAHEITRVLITRYVDMDPEAALEFLHSHLTTSTPDYRDLLIVLYRELALRDAQYAWASIDRIPSLQDRESVKTWLLTRGVISSPETLAELRSGLTNSERRTLSFAEMSRQQPEELYRAALGIENRQEQLQMISMAINRWAEEDPEAAFNAVETLTDENLKYSLYQMVFHNWAAKDVESALLAAESLDDPRQRHLGAVLMVLAREDPMAALEVADRQDIQSQNSRLLQQIVSGWAANDPMAAAAYVESLDEFRKVELVHTVAMAYMNQSPGAAFDWVAKIRPNNSAVLSMVSQQYVSQSPTAAKDKIDSMPPGPVRDSLISAYVGVVARSDPLDMLSWIRQFEDEDIYQNVHSQVVSGWMVKDPEGAADYVQSLQDGQFKQQKMMELIGRWSHTDSDRAIKMLREMDSGPMKDQGLNMIAMSVAGRDWKQAMEFVDNIADKNIQKNARINVIMRVSQVDRNSAMQLLSDYELEDDPRSDLVRNANQFGRAVAPRFMASPDIIRSVRSSDVMLIEGREVNQTESSN
jgi:hypothetical protein